MTGQQMNITPLPEGLGELLSLRKPATGKSDAAGGFLDILDRALGKDSQPARPAEAPVTQAAPGLAGSPAQPASPAPEFRTAAADPAQARPDQLPEAQPAAKAVVTAGTQPEPSGLKDRLGRMRDLLLRSPQADNGKAVPLLPAQVDKPALRGQPGLNALPAEVVPQVRKTGSLNPARQNPGSQEATQDEARLAKTKARDKTAPTSPGLREKAAETLAALQAQLNAAPLPGQRKTEPADSAGQSGLLGKALDTLKNLGSQLETKKETLNVRELDIGELLARKTGQPSRSAATAAAGRAETGLGRLGSDKDQLTAKGTDARLRSQRQAAEVARKVEVADLRGRSSLDAANGGRVMLQSGEAAVAAQSAVATGAPGRSGQKSSESGSTASGLDLGLNAAYVPARERVLQMPVAAASQGGSQSLRDWLRGQGGKEIAQEAKFLLQDGGTGEIKLILHPEELGEVRINLQIQDGRIAGDIFVENEEVRQAFQEQLASLGEAFRENGFGSSSFNVALGGQGGQDLGQFMDRDGSRDGQRKPDTRAIESLERQVTVVRELGYGNAQIDLVI